MGELSTLPEAVERLGLRGPKALYRLIEKGAPKPRAGKRGSARYDVEAIKAWREARATRVAPTLDLQAERARLARVQRHLTTLKIRQLRGELIQREAASLALDRIRGSMRAAILRLPTDAIQRGVPTEFEAVLRDLVDGALTTLARQKWSEAPADA